MQNEVVRRGGQPHSFCLMALALYTIRYVSAKLCF